MLNKNIISIGKNDECYTFRYAVEPLLKFLEPLKQKIIWCPFDDEDSEFVKVFSENGFEVVFSHIKYGQDFLYYEPKQWDLIVSNPPFTGKRKIFERALSFNKPFALLMTLDWLNDAAPKKLFINKDLQLLMFIKRMEFKNQSKRKQITFSTAYYCWNFLPKQIIISDFDTNQIKLDFAQNLKI